MLTQLTIPKTKAAEAGLNQEKLFDLGLKHVQRLAGRIWTDYNAHDPGVTTLELLSYAITDLSYRATLPLKDLLTGPGNQPADKQFFTAREILPNAPLTLLDYRKLLIDIKGVKNAWLRPATLVYYADSVKGGKLQDSPAAGLEEVRIRGLYDVTLEYDDNFDEPQENVNKTVMERLHANRNLCEDFTGPKPVEAQQFLLCAEIELTPEADVARVNCDILFQVQQYLAPPVHFYSLSEMLERTKAGGSAFSVDEIFNGPALERGFIDDEELAAADLRTEIRLSDLINIIMDIEGVRAIRDIVINPQGTQVGLADKWVVAVAPRKKAVLNEKSSRLVYYKGNMPVSAAGAAPKLALPKPPGANDLNIPLGAFRDPGSYYPFQNHFPATYALGEHGLGAAADPKRKALAQQLKAYLLFFDQLMANYLAQLSHAKDLLSSNPDLGQTYFTQEVESLKEDFYMADALKSLDEDAKSFAERRNRFLDHLIARFAEHFTAYAHITSAAGTDAKDLIRCKCDFLNNYPAISSRRGLAYNYTLQQEPALWNSENVSGLEHRLAKLLGIRNFARRNLADLASQNDNGEGMYLIEAILLRPDPQQPENTPDPFLCICPNAGRGPCVQTDPYSYRLIVILPAYACRFHDINFRRFAEEVIRQETPAHILPRICWISRQDMVLLEKAYRDWIYLKAGVETGQRQKKLQALLELPEKPLPPGSPPQGILFTVRNVYQRQHLRECKSTDKFLLGDTALGTQGEQ